MLCKLNHLTAYVTVPDIRGEGRRCEGRDLESYGPVLGFATDFLFDLGHIAFKLSVLPFPISQILLPLQGCCRRTCIGVLVGAQML